MMSLERHEEIIRLTAAPGISREHRAALIDLIQDRAQLLAEQADLAAELAGWTGANT
ncbi:hypothetical protein OG369_10055 [Streptomyces sp. NBC_01221]|uniref:hypothetical protein n=1 Tax=Streptomyces sp. NBC_01221 TaxID=2903782 RepID=UPI002253A89B|nr:hypothetical protein [Streptomyces sp. NBC_01221]MCX4786515.1 hypothetical protein [Streptomyces sp. NBC_01221]